MSYAGDLVAIDKDGGQLYAQAPEVNLRSLQAAGGRFYLGGSSLYSVATGVPVFTLPVDSRTLLLLTASRMYLWSYDASTDRSTVSAVELNSGDALWQQGLRARNTDTTVPFNVAGERAVIIDPQDVLHVVRADDGTDLLACKVAPGVRSPVLLQGGRLAVQRYPNLEVYDLPW
jgi:hypothetical protein